MIPAADYSGGMSAPVRTVRDLTGLLNSAGHALTRRLTAELAEVGLTPRMQCVLIHALEEPRTQIELAVLADLDKTTMVDTVDALERHGWAERTPSPRDRRARIIRVTAAGSRVAGKGQEVVDRVHADVLAALPAGVRKGFADALATVAEQVAEQEAAPVRGVRRPRASSTTG